jgi:hypothetical protein
MSAQLIPLRRIAHARSGDKGNNVNIGVIAYTPAGYAFLTTHLTAKRVHEFFRPLGTQSVERFELPNLEALNFVLKGALGGGGSCSLRIDSQGKALGQAILEMAIEASQHEVELMLPQG